MADILITSTGRKFHHIDPTLATILQELFPEAVKPLAPGPPRPVHPANAASATIASPAEPIWKIIKAETTGQICVQCDWLRTTMRFGGDPANVHKMVVGPHKIPTAVADEYVRLKLQEADPATRLEWEQEKRRHEAADLVFAGGGTMPKEG